MPAKGYKKADSRGYMLRVRLTEDEHKLLESLAKKHKKGLSSWVRSLILNEAKRKKLPPP
jgi:uncharacterized protein (DUF1778 family)